MEGCAVQYATCMGSQSDTRMGGNGEAPRNKIECTFQKAGRFSVTNARGKGVYGNSDCSEDRGVAWRGVQSANS